MVNIDISQMTADDIPHALELETQCFPAPWTHGMFMSELTNPLCHYLAARDGERLVGYAGMCSILDEGNVNNIAVVPDCQRGGIGTALMRALIERSKQLSLSFLSLEVRKSNESAINLYLKLGFVKTGTRRAYYENPREDALIMTLFF